MRKRLLTGIGLLTMLIVGSLLLDRAPDPARERRDAATPLDSRGEGPAPPDSSRAAAESAPQEAESATGARPSLLVLSAADGTPIPGASVKAWIDGASVAIGESDRNGLVVADPLEAHWSTIEAEGFASTALRPARSRERRIVRLATEARIEGIVVKAGMVPAGPGIRVVAWLTTDAAPTPAELASAIASGVGVRHATTTSDGGFVLRGLEHGKHYHLLAGGNGLATVELDHAVAAPSSGRRLVVWQCHAAILELRDEQGAPLDLGIPRVRGANELAVAVTMQDRDRLRLELPLAAHLSSPRLGAVDPGDVVVGAISVEYGSSIAPVVVNARPPGFRTIGAELELPSLREELPRVRVTAVRDAPLGALLAKFVHVSSTGTVVPLAFVPDGFLHVRRLDSSGARYEFRVRGDDSSAVARIDGIPIGDHQVCFLSLRDHGRFARSYDAAEKHEIEIRGDLEVEVGFRVDRSAAVRIELEDADLLPFWADSWEVGLAAGDVERSGENAWTLIDAESLSIDDAGATIEVAPGRFSLWLQWQARVTTPFLAIDAVAGEVTRVRLQR